ncbi:hypothetical protein EYB53_021515 [Candidatus Chloroploca sp. M-50]|uniref:Dual OB-containing domain-containing protein n=1 Tax=Candidatus Chloroploca mongolica TaxID=2528176 RepID=A0ABS4DFS6_9CHLR|nr:hypothetical protein [Candidatus Chloroploca mongolica]MBP1468304.1 hypothetical protein [Candidatus Chloroploca mongolica]
MKKLFVCLANSKKYGNRCIAGIELQKTELGFRVVRNNDAPIWIRPVSNQEHGEVDSHLVDHISLLDVVEITVTSPMPKGYQSENCLFLEEILQVVSKTPLRKDVLDRLCSQQTGMLFGNRGKAVHSEKINELNHSLILIRPQEFSVYTTMTDKNKEPIRASFIFAGTTYDLPITDIEFEQEYYKNKQLLDSVKHIYLTISLGVEHNGWHSKLIAGIVYF